MQVRKNFSAARDKSVQAVCRDGQGTLTEFQMLLWTGEKLCYACRKPLGENEIFASKQMLANQKHQDLDQIGEQRNLLESEVVYCSKSADVDKPYKILLKRNGLGLRITYMTVSSPNS